MCDGEDISVKYNYTKHLYSTRRPVTSLFPSVWFTGPGTETGDDWPAPRLRSCIVCVRYVCVCVMSVCVFGLHGPVGRVGALAWCYSPSVWAASQAVLLAPFPL